MTAVSKTHRRHDDSMRMKRNCTSLGTDDSAVGSHSNLPKRFKPNHYSTNDQINGTHSFGSTHMNGHTSVGPTAYSWNPLNWFDSVKTRISSAFCASSHDDSSDPLISGADDSQASESGSSREHSSRPLWTERILTKSPTLLASSTPYTSSSVAGPGRHGCTGFRDTSRDWGTTTPSSVASSRRSSVTNPFNNLRRRMKPAANRQNNRLNFANSKEMEMVISSTTTPIRNTKFINSVLADRLKTMVLPPSTDSSNLAGRTVQQANSLADCVRLHDLRVYSQMLNSLKSSADERPVSGQTNGTRPISPVGPGDRPDHIDLSDQSIGKQQHNAGSCNASVDDIINLYSPPTSPESSVLYDNSCGRQMDKSVTQRAVCSSDFVQSLQQKYVTKQSRRAELINQMAGKSSILHDSTDRVGKFLEGHGKLASLFDDLYMERVAERDRRRKEETAAKSKQQEVDTLTPPFTLPPISDTMANVINHATKQGVKHDQPLAEAFNISITAHDIESLAGLNWLNDEIINFYMQLICERAEKSSKLPSVYAFSTFFYPRLAEKGFAAVKRWTRKINLFSYDLLLVPVHLQMHWCLAIIDVRAKAVKYYDSMGGENQPCLSALLQYLQQEHADKNKAVEPFNVDVWSADHATDIPRQMNGSDCGMFACKFAECLARDDKIQFSQKDMPYYRRRMVYEIIAHDLMSP